MSNCFQHPDYFARIIDQKILNLKNHLLQLKSTKKKKIITDKPKLENAEGDSKAIKTNSEQNTHQNSKIKIFRVG